MARRQEASANECARIARAMKILGAITHDLHDSERHRLAKLRELRRSTRASTAAGRPEVLH